ncbi:MAG: histidine kinase, partial [Bacteroidetes bacterium]|nr:histidine kinase [Bacteroidota bacterium]
SGRFTQYTTDGSPFHFSYPNIHGLLAVGKRLYAGPFQHGLEIMDINSGQVKERFRLIGPPDTMFADFVMSIYRTRDKQLLVGTTGNGAGLYVYHPEEHLFSRYPGIPGGVYVYALAEDHEGTIWTGSLEKGAYWYNPHTGQSGNISFAEHGSGHAGRDYQVHGIFEDSRHTLWFSTEGGGLVKLSPDRKSFKKFTTQDGLPSNNIFRMLEDDNGQLWISTLKGLVCMNMQTEKFTIYTQSNGLLTDQFNYNSAFRAPDGKMYFGTVKGMIAFNPRDFGKASYTPPIYITGFQVNNKEVMPDSVSSPLTKSIIYTDSVVLQHNQSNFSIEFAALNYSSPTVTRYKYFMKGLDKDWTYLNSNRMAYFTDLAPGSYTFIVQAESNVGSWTGPERRLFIKILPPFWKSTWADILYALIAGLILWLSIRYYHRYNERKNINKLRLFEHEKEKEIYQAKIEFFTNIAHEIQTPLTLILGPLELLLKRVDEFPSIKKSLQIMDKSGKRLRELTTQLLDFRRTEAHQFGLNFVNVSITNILREQIAIFRPEADKTGISISTGFAAEDFEAYVDKEAFIKICSNLLSNAIKYASSRVMVTIPAIGPSDKTF